MLAETEVDYGRFLVGAGWQSLYLICPTNVLKAHRILLATVDTILFRLDLPRPLLYANLCQPARRAAFNLKKSIHTYYLPLVFWPLSVSLKRTKNKISDFGLYTTKTVYYEVCCCIVVG